VAATDNLRVDPVVMGGFAQALHGGAEELRNRLADLDQQVSGMLVGWRGTSGSAYTSAWELWHRGAGEVEVGLSMLSRSIAKAARVYQDNESASARSLREAGNG
jgi:WXG100 family type VII secretion target